LESSSLENEKAERLVCLANQTGKQDLKLFKRTKQKQKHQN